MSLLPWLASLPWAGCKGEGKEPAFCFFFFFFFFFLFFSSHVHGAQHVGGFMVATMKTRARDITTLMGWLMPMANEGNIMNHGRKEGCHDSRAVAMLRVLI